MPSKSSTPEAASKPTVHLSGFLAILLATVLIVAAPWVAPGASAADKPVEENKDLSTANAMALPDTYQVTVTLEDFGDTLEFSTLTAQRHFTLAPAERTLQFRGRLWLQRDGRELLDFSIEFHQALPTPENRAPGSRQGSWHGSTYFESGRPVEVVTNPDSKIAVTLTKR